MTAIVYPLTLPGPRDAPFTPAERRLLAQEPAPFETRTTERDRRGMQTIEFPPFTDAEAEDFRDWYDEELTFGAAWFAADWPMPEGFTSVVRKWIDEPTWQRVTGGFWKVSGECEVRGRGDAPQTDGDLWARRVVSLLHFDDILTMPTYPPGYPSQTSVVSERTFDVAGKRWKLWGNEHAQSSSGGGVLALEEYQLSGGFSNSCLQCLGPGGEFLASDEFCIELKLHTRGHASYISSGAFVLVSATVANLGDLGGWRIFAQNGQVIFLIKGLLGLQGVSTEDGPTGNGGGLPMVPSNGEMAVRVNRKSGVCRVFIDGVLKGRQSPVLPLNFTPLSPIPPTIGARTNGGYYIPNDYGTGDYKEFRFTVGDSYEIVDYVVPTRFPDP